MTPERKLKIVSELLDAGVLSVEEALDALDVAGTAHLIAHQKELVRRSVRLAAKPRWTIPKEVRVCDCGALKAKTTHANWCSTEAK